MPAIVQTTIFGRFSQGYGGWKGAPHLADGGQKMKLATPFKLFCGTKPKTLLSPDTE
jgi:hypothetical protein